MDRDSTPKGLAGLVLAGGLGRRWGGPKAWARLPGGQSFLEACVGVLREGGAAVIVATVPPAAVARGPRPVDVEVVELARPDLDMFASVRIGLGRLLDEPGWTSVVLLPVDHPLVRPSTVRALAETAGRAAIASRRGKHGHPVRLDRRVATDIAAGRLAGPTLREVLRSVEAVDVEVDDPGVTANCNTPEALEFALFIPINSREATGSRSRRARARAEEDSR